MLGGKCKTYIRDESKAKESVSVKWNLVRTRSLTDHYLGVCDWLRAKKHANVGSNAVCRFFINRLR